MTPDPQPTTTERADELAVLRNLYGAKFDAITVALGYAVAACECLAEGDTEAVERHRH